MCCYNRKENKTEYTTPKEFTKTKGVSLLTQHSKTSEETYVANSCTHCLSFVGEHFAENVLLDALYNLTTYKTYDIDKF